MDDDTTDNTPVEIVPGITPIEISQEMRRSYLNYAMSVIVTRALPDVKDGLKPVHRRILYAMHKLGLHHTARFSKSAKVVGEVLGKYHPHGDVPVYDSLVRMAQTFSMRYPLVIGQGNFGSIDGDSPAAMRYTEVKLAKISQEMVSDIDKDTVDWTDNFDATLKEPLFLPAMVPNLLLMGAEGIAVGMATRIPPHNLTEVVDAILYMIENSKAPEPEQPSTFSYKAPTPYELSFDPELEGIPLPDGEVQTQSVSCSATLDELMNYITGPDFPTGAHIFGLEDIKQAYATGRGKIMVRGVMEEETVGKREAIIIKEIPYQTNKANLIAKIADLVRDKKIVGIADLRDESDKDGIRVVIELKKDAAYNKVLNNLFKHTELQGSYPVNMVALINNIPQTVSLQTILEEYLKHRIDVVKRRSIFELKAAKKRAHILEGLLKALDHIDQIIEIIKKSRDESIAREQLMSQFGFSILQTQAILDMQLKRLTGLERGKIEEELKGLQDTINFLHGILTDVFLMLNEIKKQLVEIKELYGDARRTKVFKTRPGEISNEQLIEDKQVIVTLTNEGYIKTVPLDTFKVQHRGGKGVSGITTKDEDAVSYITSCQMHDFILFFSNKGKVYRTRVWEIPEGSRTSKGKAVVNVIGLGQDEKVTSVLTIQKNVMENPKDHFICMSTIKGTMKKTPLSDFGNIKAGGIISIKLTSDDALQWAHLTNNTKLIAIATRQGKCIVFKEQDVRSMGRATQGVRGILLDPQDIVTSMDVVDVGDTTRRIFVLGEKGIGKTTKLSLFPVQRRGGKGVKLATVDQKTGAIVFSCVVPNEKETLLVTSKGGQVVKIPIAGIPTLSRTAKGVILMRLSDSKQDAVASATFL